MNQLDKSQQQYKWEESFMGRLIDIFNGEASSLKKIDLIIDSVKFLFDFEILKSKREERAKTIREMDKKMNAYCERKVKEARREVVGEILKEVAILRQLVGESLEFGVDHWIYKALDEIAPLDPKGLIGKLAKKYNLDKKAPKKLNPA